MSIETGIGTATCTMLSFCANEASCRYSQYCLHVDPYVVLGDAEEMLHKGVSQVQDGCSTNAVCHELLSIGDIVNAVVNPMPSTPTMLLTSHC